MTKSCYLLLSITFLLMLFGLVMVYGTTTAEILEKSQNLPIEALFFKHCIHMAIACCLIVMTIYFSHSFLITYNKEISLFIIILLLLVFIPGIGMKINGAYRWINFVGISFQPSEIAKIVFPISALVYFHRNSVTTMYQLLLPLSIYMIGVFLIFLQPDNGSVFTLLVLFSVCVFISRVPFSLWVPPLLALCVVGGILAFNMPYVSKRLSVYMNPELDILGKGHQPFQSKIAVGSGGVFGRGLGKSLQKLSYLPEARSDYIAAIVAEEFGFVGSSVVLILFALIGITGFRILILCRNSLDAKIGTIILFLFLFHVFIHFGVVSGLLPSKGANLPFISHGGSSLFASAISMGILISIGLRKKEVYG